MSRHSKHANTKSIMTAHERSQGTNFGQQKARLTADSQRPWDSCCLSLMPVGADPVCTPYGNMFNYEALLTNLLEQKQRYKRDMKAYRKQQEAAAARAAAQSSAKEAAEVGRFVDGADKLISKGGEPTKKKVRSETNFDISNIASDRFRGVEEMLPEPKKGTVCPETGKPLSVKQLVHVKLWKLPTPSETADTSSGLFGCPVCHAAILNSTRVVVFADTGAAICMQCAESSKEGTAYRNPFSSKISNVIMLKRGGTGYVGNSDQAVEVKKDGIAFQFG